MKQLFYISNFSSDCSGKDIYIQSASRETDVLLRNINLKNVRFPRRILYESVFTATVRGEKLLLLKLKMF
jgi:hypothetical protein